MVDTTRHTQGYPSMTAREHWGKYAAGIATEVLFILWLTLIAYLLALSGMAIWE